VIFLSPTKYDTTNSTTPFPAVFLVLFIRYQSPPPVDGTSLTAIMRKVVLSDDLSPSVIVQ
jgi:hypothetical protein